MMMRGFQLMELLVTLAIVSILVAISIPAYSHYMTAVRRFEAETVLVALATALEQYHLEHNSYLDATLAALHFPSRIVKDHYQLVIAAAEDDDYRISAVPTAQQAAADAACGILTLGANGEKSISGTGTIATCW